MSELFHTRAPGWPQIQKAATGFRDAHGTSFSSPAEATQFLNYIFTPADGSWAFKPNGKAGTTSTLHFLFHLMFGVPLSVQALSHDSLHTDSAAGHMLNTARVFSMLAARGDGRDPQEVLDAALRLTTVRHPLTRAISGFLYLCRSHKLSSESFYPERARMNARVGFDWERHPETPEGFERFLRYLEIELAHCDSHPLNSHFRPQVLNIRPDIFRPELVGRCEAMPAFFTEIAARLDRPLPGGAMLSHPMNRQAGHDRDALITPGTKRLVETIFAEDFKTFGYSPDPG